MSKPKQVKLNGKTVADIQYLGVLITKSTDRVIEVLGIINETLRELLGSNHAVSLPRAMSPPPPQVAGELPPIQEGTAEEALKRFSPLAQEWLVLHPRGWKMKHYSHDPEVWRAINEELRGHGYKWVKDSVNKKDSHWE
jgi:hypothetical protein